MPDFFERNKQWTCKRHRAVLTTMRSQFMRVDTSASFLDEASVRSPRKWYFYYLENHFLDQSVQKYISFNFETEALVDTYRHYVLQTLYVCLIPWYSVDSLVLQSVNYLLMVVPTLKSVESGSLFFTYGLHTIVSLWDCNLSSIVVGGRHFWLFVLVGGPPYIL